MTYRPDIDGLRAIAILLVVVFHFEIVAQGKAGFIGVDVFFVISGFLITNILIADLEAGTFGYGRFIYRRLRRLYPSMLVVLTLFFLVSLVVFLPDMTVVIMKEIIYSQLYVINFHFWQTINYFGLPAADIPLLHMWSLAVEEQFYAIYPLFLLILFRAFRRHILLLLSLSLLASFCLGVVASSWKPEAAFYLLPTRAWELMVGGLLALVSRRHAPRGWPLLIAGPAGLALILAALVVHTPATPVPGTFVLLPTLGAALLIAGGFDRGAPVTRFLSTAPMVLIGRISYPLYLVHWPVLIVLRDQTPDMTAALRYAGFAASFLLAWLIYRLVERPIRSGAVLSRPGPFLGAVLVPTALLVMVGWVGVRSDGFPGRFPEEVGTLLAHSRDLPHRYTSCAFTGQGADQMCRLGADAAEPDTLIMGDSHAFALAGAFDLWLRETGRSALFVFTHACLPVEGAGDQRCRDMNRRGLEVLRQEPGLKTLTLVSIWRQPYEGSGALFGGTWYPRDRVQDAFTAALVQTVRAAVDMDRAVLLVDPLFAAPRPVPVTMAKNAAFDRNWPVDTPRAEHDTWFGDLFSAFAAAEEVGARRLSLIEDLCRTGTCVSVYEGRPIFTDNNHVTDSMAGYFAAVIGAQMAAVSNAVPEASPSGRSGD